MSSELVHGRNQYAWMAPKPTLVGVFGQPGGPSIDLARVAKTLRDSFKQGRAWASEPLPAIAAPPPTEALRIPADGVREACGAGEARRSTSRSGPDASREPALRLRRRSRQMSTTATPAVRTAWTR